MGAPRSLKTLGLGIAWATSACVKDCPTPAHQALRVRTVARTRAGGLGQANFKVIVHQRPQYQDGGIDPFRAQVRDSYAWRWATQRMRPVVRTAFDPKRSSRI